MPIYSAMNYHLERQLKFWKNQKNKIDDIDKPAAKPFITISRQYGCGGFEVASIITDILNKSCDASDQECCWAAYDKKIFEDVMKDMGLAASLAETLTTDARQRLSNIFLNLFDKLPAQAAIYKKLFEIIRMMALHGKVIIVGRAGNYITRDMEGGFHVRLIADMDWRIDRVSTLKKISKDEAEKLIIQKCKERGDFFKDFIKHDLSDQLNYHLTLNNSKLSNEEIANIIISSMKIKSLIK